MASLMPNGKQQYFNPSTGAPLAGGLLYTYVGGTSTPKDTWQDAAATMKNANPVPLDASGSAVVFWSGNYKVVLCDPLGNVIYTVDNYSTDSREHPVQVEMQTATAGQTVFTLAQTTYTPGINSLHVYVDGLRMFMPDYAETSGTVVTFASPLVAGQAVMFECGSAANSQSSLDASIVPYTPGGGGATTNVAAALNGKPDSSALAASGGSALVGFQQAGTGAVARTAQDKLRATVSVTDFGATGDGATDDTAAIQAAQTYCAGLAYGATLYFPRGRYITSATLALNANVNWRGDGRLATQIFYTGTGDGVKFSGTVNAYTNLRIRISDLTITTNNAAPTGGGIVLESCAYVELQNVYVEAFKYGHILDQVIHFRCSYSEIALTKRAGVWIVYGSDRRGAATTAVTSNNIWYGTEVQLNPAATAGYYCLQDDGGGNHNFTGVNFNGGDIQARFAGVTCLYLANCDFENSSATPILLTDTTREAGAYVGPVNSFTLENFSSTCVGPYEIQLDAAQNGRIEGAIFASYGTAAFNFSSGKVANVRIANNNKLVTGTARCAKPFFDTTLTAALKLQNDTDSQPGVTYVTAAVAATGVQNATPASMENIRIGDTLWVQNADGTNGEQVIVLGIPSPTLFTANFTTTKAANWTIQGQSKTATEGTFTPTVIGTTTAGVQTYTTQYGYWKKQGNKVHVTGTVAISAKDAAMAGAPVIGGLPFPAVNIANRNGNANFGYWSGLTFPANFTQLAGLITPNTSQIALRRMGSGQSGAPLAVSELGASATFIFDATYYVS